jgi:sugar phosphate isomerase/epimerase
MSLQEEPAQEPLISSGRIMAAVNQHPDHELEVARRYGVGVEVQCLALPRVLDDAPVRHAEKLRSRLEGLRRVGIHGAFIDTCHFSLDSEIRRAARKRYLESIDLGEVLGADSVVFHSQYNPIIKVPGYLKLYVEGSREFWPEVLEYAHERGMVVYLENMFDHSPEPIRRVMEAVDNPSFQVCLDVAHTAVFSDQPFEAWVEALGPYVGHIHMNDTHGEEDSHLGLGQGSLDLAGAVAALDRLEHPFDYVLETGLNTEVSMAFLGIDPLDCSS